MLRRLVRERYTSGKAAEVMGLTRSAVMGRSARLGLTFDGVRNDKTRSLRVQAPKINPSMSARQPIIAPIPDHALDIMKLKAGRCRWPLWPFGARPTPASFYCGGETNGRPYCGFHEHVSHHELAAVVEDQKAA